jgi:hypothetical protein
MIYILSCIAGGICGMIVSWALGLYGPRWRGGNLGRDQVIWNEGRTIRGNGNGGPTTPNPGIPSKPQPAGDRLYKGAFYRMKGSDIWYPVGTEPDWSELAHEQVRRRGSNPPPPGGYQPLPTHRTHEPPPREP